MTDCLVVHPGAVSSILQLLPTVTSDENPVVSCSISDQIDNNQFDLVHIVQFDLSVDRLHILSAAVID